MATFNPSVVSQLLQSAHRESGGQDTSVRDLKNVTKKLHEISDSLTEKSEWLTSDIEHLQKALEFVESSKKSLDSESGFGKNVIGKLNELGSKLQVMLSGISKTGKFTDSEDNGKTKDKKSIDDLDDFLRSTIFPSIIMSRDLILTTIFNMWNDIATQSKFNLKKLNTSVAFIDNSITTNKLLNAELNAKTNSIIGNFASNVTSMFKSGTIKLFPTLAKISSKLNSVWLASVTFFTTTLPLILIISGLIALAVILIIYLWTHFKVQIKQIWEFIKENWKTIGKTLLALSGAWAAYKLFQAGKWLIQEAWNKAKVIWDGLKWSAQFLWNAGKVAIDAVRWAIQVAWQAGGFIVNLVKGIVPIMGAMFAWIAGVGFPWLCTILAAVPVIGWIILAIGAISALLYYFRDDIFAAFKVAWDFYTKIFDSIWNWVSGFWETLWAGLKETVTGSISGVMAGLGDALNPFSWFASGGEVSKPVKGIIGEAGPEAIIPLSGSGDSKLSKALIEFFEFYVPLFKPTIDFLWNTFRPIISGDQLNKHVFVNVMGTGSKNITESLFAIVGQSRAEVMTLPRREDSNTYMANILASALDKFSWKPSMIGNSIPDIQEHRKSVSSLSDNISPSDNGSKNIEKGLAGLSKQLENAVNVITNAVASNKGNSQPDPAYEMSKMISRGQIGGKI